MVFAIYVAHAIYITHAQLSIKHTIIIYIEFERIASIAIDKEESEITLASKVKVLCANVSAFVCMYKEEMNELVYT